MRILVACEESQAVTIEMRKLGHEAYSCDIQECSGGHPEWHLQQDVIPLLNERWDMIIAFPLAPTLRQVERDGLRRNVPTADSRKALISSCGLSMRIVRE